MDSKGHSTNYDDDFEEDEPDEVPRFLLEKVKRINGEETDDDDKSESGGESEESGGSSDGSDDDGSTGGGSDDGESDDVTDDEKEPLPNSPPKFNSNIPTDPPPEGFRTWIQYSYWWKIGRGDL